MGGGRQLISVYPEELAFEFVLEKSCYCHLKVVNNTEHHVAFKVKTTSPKKYFVRPNTGVVQPWDSCFIRVTLQAQQEYPPDMQCKDKFLLLSTTVPPSTDLDEVPPDTFSKDGGKPIEECKLRVVYAGSQHPGHGEELGLTSSMSRVSEQSSDNASVQTIQRLKEDRDSTLQLNQQLQRELDMLMRRRSRKSDTGFSFRFAVFVGIIGIMVGFILNLTLSSPPPE